MTKYINLLFLLFILPFLPWAGGSSSARAAFYGEQAPAFESNMYSTDRNVMSSGSFSTTVHPLDENGYAVYLGGESPFTSSGPRRVGGGSGGPGSDLPSDPFDDGNISPVGDIPWAMFILLLALYALRLHTRHQSAH